MANHFDPEYIRQQQLQQEEERRQQQQQQQPKKPAPEKPKVSRSVSEAGMALRRFLGGEFLHKLHFWKNMPYFIMVFVMLIVLIYINLKTLSYQTRLEMLDKTRIELNDKYIRIMDRREQLNVDESRREALLEVYRNKGFVDDSSLVYMLHVDGKEGRP
jgi:hypothetical protein